MSEQDALPANMAKLPAQLLFRLCGSGLPFPKRRPTMSAMPSPPHMSATATIPVGDSRQYTAVTAISTRM